MDEIPRHEETQLLHLVDTRENSEVLKLLYLQTVAIKGDHPAKPEVIQVHEVSSKAESDCFVEVQSFEKDADKMFDKIDPKMRSVSIRQIIREDTCITLQGPNWETIKEVANTICDEDPELAGRGISVVEQPGHNCVCVIGPFGLVGHLRTMVFTIFRLMVEFSATKRPIRDLVQLALDKDYSGEKDEDTAESDTKAKMHKNATSSYSVPKLTEFPLQNNKHKLVFATSHFLYEDADIKIIAICSELGFNEPANKNLDEQLKGSLQQTIGRRYQKSKPDKFDVFTIHCPPSTIGCRFLVVVNILVCNVERGQDDHKFLRQILHGVLKEADTLEMPKALVSADSFRSLGFPHDVLLPLFIQMLSQYRFTNDDFLTEVKFSAASQEDLLNLVAIAKRTVGTKVHGKDDCPGEGSFLDSQNSEKEHGNVAKMYPSGSSKQEHNRDCCTNLDPGIVQLMLKCQMFSRDHLKCSADFTSVHVLGEYRSSQELANFIASYESLAGGKGLVYDTLPVQGLLDEDSLVMWLSDLESKFPRVVFIPDISNQYVHLLSVDHEAISDIKRHPATTADGHAQTQYIEGGKSASPPVVIQMGGQRILTVKKGDLVREEVTAIVNAANEQLQHGAGVALAIDRASHGRVQWESKHVIKEAMKHRIPTGQVALTRAGGDLKCQAVIHAVGPDANVRKIEDCKGLLKQACENSLKCAEEKGIGSVAFPPISSGIYGMPKDLVAQILIDTILYFPYKHKSSLRDIRIVIIDDETLVPFLKYAQHVVADASMHTGIPTCETSTDSPVPAATSLAVEIPLEKSHRKLLVKVGHFLYEHADIKVAAICSELGFAVGLNKDLNESLNGELKTVVERRYQSNKPERFDVFTVHCPPTVIGCRFLVIANVLNCNLGNHQDHNKYLQQILHSVFKEADTLEMPTVAIAVNSFATVGFNAESVLPSFVRMFNHYQFTNNEFLTDVRFLAHSEKNFNALVSTVERSLGTSLQPPISKLPVTVDEETKNKDQNQGISWPGQILGYATGAVSSTWKALNPFSRESDSNNEGSQGSNIVIPLSATCTLTVKKGNIIEECTTAIVNPTNTHLKHESGVAAAINKASNGMVQKESDAYMRRRGDLLQPGGVAVTAAGGNLHCKHIIHAVGPDARKLPVDKCKELLEQTCCNILQCAEDPKKQITSIALPAISSGIYAMPKDIVAQILIDSILRYPYRENCLLVDIRIVIIDDEMLQPFLHYVQQVLQKHEPMLKEDMRHSLPSTSQLPPVVTVKSPASSSIVVKVTKKAGDRKHLDGEDMAISQNSRHRKLFVSKGHFLYVNADIKVVAINSGMGFDKGINKNVNNQLKGLLKQTMDRRYQNGKPDKFDVFTVHCPPSTIGCRFLVVANILDRTFGKHKDNHKHLQQILHSVFKEADTLEMPTVAIAPTTFAIGGFSRDSILPAFVTMFNQYQFTNDDFLTDVKFIATAEEFPHLRAVAECSTTSMTVSKPVPSDGSGQTSQSKQPEVAAAVVTGDIVQFPADAIVVPVSPSLEMRGATSQAVNDASNGQVLKQCSHLRGSLVEGKVVTVTCKAEWNIQANFLYFLVRSKNTKMDVLKQACAQALQTAKTRNLSSIAFPLVTTHRGKEEVAKAMHQVFTIFQQQPSQSDLTITVVIKKDDTAIHEAFIKFFLPRTRSGSLNNESWSSEV